MTNLQKQEKGDFVAREETKGRTRVGERGKFVGR
jgi:hypothetical protein